MMVPEAWENNTLLAPDVRAFAEFHSSAHGALGRPGLRHLHRWPAARCRAGPQRASPRPLVADRRRHGGAGQRVRSAADPAGERRRARPAAARPDVPGGHRGRRILDDAEVKGALAAEHPYADWVHAGIIQLPDLPAREHIPPVHDSVLRRQQVFGYTEEELRIIVSPMAAAGAEGDRLDGHRHAGGGDVRAHAHAVRLLLPAVRPGHQPAAGRHPRAGGHLVGRRLGPEQNLLEPSPGVLPADGPAAIR